MKIDQAMLDRADAYWQQHAVRGGINSSCKWTVSMGAGFSLENLLVAALGCPCESVPKPIQYVTVIEHSNGFAVTLVFGHEDGGHSRYARNPTRDRNAAVEVAQKWAKEIGVEYRP